MGFEKNVVMSFKKVRDEMENLQHQISELKEKVEDIDKILLKREKVKTVRTKRVIKKRK